MTIKDLFDDTEKALLNDERPSDFLNGISDSDMFKEYPFSYLYKLKQTEQSPVHHPEGNVWNHTLLVVDRAAKEKTRSKNPKVFMWAALLHDIGKTDTTKRKKGKITSYDHERVGAALAEKFLLEFCDDDNFIKEVVGLVRWHMQILHVVKGMPFANVDEMNKQTIIEEVALLGLCDRLGRLNPNEKKEKSDIRLFIEKCNKALK